MTMLAGLLHPFRTSIAWRMVALVALAAVLGVVLMLGFTRHEMFKRLGQEGDAMLALAEQKTGARIDAELVLVQNRLKMKLALLEDNLANIAGAPSTLQAIRTRNDERIANAVGKSLRRAGFAGGIVLDHKLDVIGAERAGLELFSAQAALHNHDLNETFRDLLDNNDRARPNAYRFRGVFDHALAALMLAPVQDQYGTLVAWPVFDDFGEPVALIVAYYAFRMGEPSLDELSRILGNAVMLKSGNALVSVAGGISIDVADTHVDDELIRAQGHSGRCAPVLPLLNACIFHKDVDIVRFRDELTAVGTTGMERTQGKLLVAGLMGLILIITFMTAFARRLTRPLIEISEAVERVSRGEWRVDVEHADRQDELGLIARAVAAMQVSLIERDRMRQEMVRIDAINQRRLVLDNAVSRFEDGMAVVMRNISGTIRMLAQTSATLDQAARDADMQAERIRSTSLTTATTANVVSGATLELTQNILEIGKRVQNTNSAVHEGEGYALDAGRQIQELAAVARQAEDALGAVQSLVADLGHLGLKASLDVVSAGETAGGFSPLAQSLREIAEKTGHAAGRIGQELSRLNAVADHAAASLNDVRAVLGGALRETSEITVVVAEQNAATQEIADGLSAAANAMAGLTEAVDHLRGSMAGAHEATSDFVNTARRIVDDAKQIDESVRSFVREVAA